MQPKPCNGLAACFPAVAGDYRCVTRPAIAPTDAIAVNAMLLAVRQGADVICDRWSLSLVVAALKGDFRFATLVKRTGLASRLATLRLRMLVEHGIMVRLPYSMRPLRHEYRLTNMGNALLDVILQMWRWEQRWGCTPVPLGFVHATCGAALDPILCCRACEAEFGARDIRLRVGRAELERMPVKQVLHRRSIISSAGQTAVPALLGPSLDVFGDKWSIELLVCAFTRIRRFNDFRACTDISASILTDRLGRLTALGILIPTAAQGYRLTDKGIDTYGVLVTLQEWADSWISHRTRSPVKLTHIACGHAFHPVTVCRSCASIVVPGAVRAHPGA